MNGISQSLWRSDPSLFVQRASAFLDLRGTGRAKIRDSAITDADFGDDNAILRISASKQASREAKAYGDWLADGRISFCRHHSSHGEHAILVSSFLVQDGEMGDSISHFVLRSLSRVLWKVTLRLGFMLEMRRLCSR